MMRVEATMRNAGFLVIQRGLSLGGGFLYAALIPRMMGPEVYGQFALITSLSLWFSLASGLGITQVISRETPPLASGPDLTKLRAFFGQLLTVRIASGAAAGLAFMLLVGPWLTEINRLALWAVATTVFVRSLSSTLYAYFLGLNQAWRWGTRDVLSRIFPLLLIVPGYQLAGLPGACLGLLIGEAAVVGVAAWWARHYLSLAGLLSGWGGLAPYLRFGLGFYASTLLVAFFQRSGEPLVRLFHGDYAQVGYFGLAYKGYLTAEAIIPQLTLSFVPFLVTVNGQQGPGGVARWAERLVRWLGIAGMLGIGGVCLLAGDVVPAVLGAAYAPVALLLVPLAWSLIPQAWSAISRLMAVVYDRPGEAVAASSLRLILLWIGGPVLVSRLGGFGASLAVLAAISGYAIYFGWRMRSVAPYRLTPWLISLLLGGWFVFLLPLRSSVFVNIGLFLLFAVVYLGLLLSFGLIRIDEIRRAWAIVRLPPEQERDLAHPGPRET